MLTLLFLLVALNSAYCYRDNSCVYQHVHAQCTWAVMWCAFSGVSGWTGALNRYGVQPLVCTGTVLVHDNTIVWVTPFQNITDPHLKFRGNPSSSIILLTNKQKDGNILGGSQNAQSGSKMLKMAAFVAGLFWPNFWLVGGSGDALPIFINSLVCETRSKSYLNSQLYHFASVCVFFWAWNVM